MKGGKMIEPIQNSLTKRWCRRYCEHHFEILVPPKAPTWCFLATWNFESQYRLYPRFHQLLACTSTSPPPLWKWHLPFININEIKLMSQPGTELMGVTLASSFLNSFIAFKKIFVKYKYKGRRFTYKVKTQISNINTQFRKFSLCTVSSNFNIC